jgi:uncharacterized protein (TIGR03435 family)
MAAQGVTPLRPNSLARSGLKHAIFRRGVALLVLGCCGLTARSQAAPATTPESFEVVSIRISPAGCCTSWQTQFPSNRLIANRVPLGFLIGTAYGVDSDKVSGPDWLDSQQYDISAKVDGDASLTLEQMRPRLQHLLEQRFHLKLHREQRVVSGYELVVAGKEMKVAATASKPRMAQITPGSVTARNIDMAMFAAILSRPAGRPTVNRTGVAGKFDFLLKFASPDAPPNSADPDFFTALQEQLGLKLIPAKVPVDYLVVDSVDRVPTEN